MAQPKRIQDRNFFCVSYLTLEQIHDVLTRKASQIKQYAYILHDMDIESDGTPKQQHFHIIVCLNHPVNLNTFINWWKGYIDGDGKAVNTLVQCAGSVSVCYRYLTHKDDPDKYQYNDILIVSTDPSYFEDERLSEADPVWELVDMILSGKSLREVARIGGRDFIYHYSAIRVLVDDIINQESHQLKYLQRKFDNGEDVPL